MISTFKKHNSTLLRNENSKRLKFRSKRSWKANFVSKSKSLTSSAFNSRSRLSKPAVNRIVRHFWVSLQLVTCRFKEKSMKKRETRLFYSRKESAERLTGCRSERCASKWTSYRKYLKRNSLSTLRSSSSSSRTWTKSLTKT